MHRTLEEYMVDMPKCSSPKGPLYCNDAECPARDKTGRHIVQVKGTDLGEGLQERLASKKFVKPPAVATVTPVNVLKQETSQEPLFDIDTEWVGGGINFYAKAKGVEPAFYAEQGSEPIVARIEGGRRRDIYIIAKGTLRVEYGKHIIRSAAKLISIGIDSDKKLHRAIVRGLIVIANQPKFEAVDIRYLGRKDETRTPIGISSPNLASAIFETLKYLND